MPQLLRINKLLSQQGIASRRKADEMISEGKVKVNGEILKQPGAIIDIEKDIVSVCGRDIIISSKKRYHYYLINKPKGYISTSKDTHARKTIMDLLPEKNGIFSIGRLDKDTTGVILVTNDGELTHRLMHPSFSIDKIYDVGIKGIMPDRDIVKLSKGVDIGDKRLSKCEVRHIKRAKSNTEIILRLHEGRNRQIRRTFAALGYDVESLNRISYAGLTASGMKPGSCRPLTEKEVLSLKKQVGLL